METLYMEAASIECSEERRDRFAFVAKVKAPAMFNVPTAVELKHFDAEALLASRFRGLA